MIMLTLPHHNIPGGASRKHFPVTYCAPLPRRRVTRRSHETGEGSYFFTSNTEHGARSATTSGMSPKNQLCRNHSSEAPMTNRSYPRYANYILQQQQKRLSKLSFVHHQDFLHAQCHSLIAIGICSNHCMPSSVLSLSCTTRSNKSFRTPRWKLVIVLQKRKTAMN